MPILDKWDFRLGGVMLGFSSGVLWALYLYWMGHMVHLEEPQAWVLFAASSLLVVLINEFSAGMWLCLLLRRRLFERLVEYRGDLMRSLPLFFICPLGIFLYVCALSLTSESNVAAVTAIYPIVALVFTRVLLGRAFKGKEVKAVGLSSLGLLAISGILSGTGGGFSSLGILMAFGCAVAWGGEAVLCYSCSITKAPSYVLLVLRYFCSVVAVSLSLIVLLAWDPGVGSKLLTIWDGGAVISVAMISLVGLLSYFAYYSSIAFIGPVRALNCNVTYMLWVFVFSFLERGHVGIHTLVGSALICAAVYVTGLKD